MAAKSRLVSFCVLAQRTKCPASRRWVAWSLVSQVSRSPWRAVGQGEVAGGEPVQQGDGGPDVLRWTVTAWSWVVSAPLVRRRSRRSRCQTA